MRPAPVLAVVLSLSPSTAAFAEDVAGVDLAAGYRFDYDDCAPARKKKDPPICTRHENLAVLTGRELTSRYQEKLPIPGRDSGGTTTVPVASLSWTDHEVVEDPDGYTNDLLVKRPLWRLRLETNGHAADARYELRSDILGPSVDHGHLVSLWFPTKEAAEAAWMQIRAVKEQLRAASTNP